MAMTRKKKPKRHIRKNSAVAAQVLDPSDIDDALKVVSDLADEHTRDVALAGGIAMQLYGSRRFTEDVDILADPKQGMLDGLHVEDRLSIGGFSSKTDDGHPVDVIMRDDDYAALYQEALEHARAFRNVPIPVVSAEHLAAMKLAAGRGKDQDDLEFLIDSEKLDVKRTRDIIARHLGKYAAREFDSMVEQSAALRKWGGART